MSGPSCSSARFSDSSPSVRGAAKDKVFVLGRYAPKLRKTGRSVGGEWVHVFTLRGEKVTVFHEFFDTAQVAEAWRG